MFARNDASEIEKITHASFLKKQINLLETYLTFCERVRRNKKTVVRVKQRQSAIVDVCMRKS
jgi:hypothetical protein